MKTVLLVEDDPDDVVVVRRAFQRGCPGARLEIAEDGEQALRYLDDSERGLKPAPAHLLLDIKLPRMSGLEVLDAVRRHPRLGALPATILTSSPLDTDRDRARALGIREYLLKPVGFSGLLDLVRRFCAGL